MPDTYEVSPAEAGEGREGDRDIVDRLRAGNEDAFVALLDRHSPAMLRLASANGGHYQAGRGNARLRVR